jgi:hypothetical protein
VRTEPDKHVTIGSIEDRQYASYGGTRGGGTTGNFLGKTGP